MPYRSAPFHRPPHRRVRLTHRGRTVAAYAVAALLLAGVPLAATVAAELVAYVMP